MVEPILPDAAQAVAIRKISPGVLTCSFPFKRFGLIKLGGRGSIVRLSTNDLAVFSAPPLTTEVRNAIENFGNGRVAYFIAPDAEHYLFIHDWLQTFPAAQVIATQTLVEKLAKGKASTPTFAIALSFPGKNDETRTNLLDAFMSEFEYAFFAGYANEIVVLHKSSKTVFIADLIFNPPALESYSKMSESATSGFFTWLFTRMRGIEGNSLEWQKWGIGLIAGKDKSREDFATAAKSVDEWDFDTMIPCHGEVIEAGAKEVWRRCFEKFIQVEQP